MRIVFMGSPVFAATILSRCLEADFLEIAAVYTQPPREAGRGMALRPTAVHALAEAAGLPVFCPRSLRHPDVQAELASFGAEAIVVVAYGLWIPTEVLAMPRYGCINVHPSLLPRWRGASPMVYPLLMGESETGTSIMRMDEGWDTGPILWQAKTLLDGTTTAASLHDALAEQGGTGLLEVLGRFARGEKVTEHPQEDAGVSHAPKLSKDLGVLDLGKQHAQELERWVRALHPWPGTRVTLGGIPLLVHASRWQPRPLGSKEVPVGCFAADPLWIGTVGDQWWMPTVVQRPGKKPQGVESFLNGVRWQSGQLLWEPDA
jgi:methionyl-tRNA formyltransferase